MTSLDALTSQIVAAQRAAAATAWMPAGSAQSLPVTGSPAAATPTGWSSTPAAVSGAVSGAGGLTMEQAIIAALQQQQFATPQATSHATSYAPVAAAAAAPSALPPVVAAASVAPAPAPAVAVAPVSAVAAGAAAAPAPAPAAASIPAAVAGFAAATGRAVANVAGAGVSHAKRVGSEVWAGIKNPRSVHVSQVPSKYNTAPAAGNKDCGPTSVVMALKMLGVAIPGVAANASPQRLINRIRELSGNTANSASTTNLDLERALKTAGAKARELGDFASVKAAILGGKPVILNGNPRHPGAYGTSFNAKQMTPYDGAHWIVVSGFDESSGKFIINDPLSKVGPVKVSAAQLDAYRGGSMGIEVSA